MEAEGLIREQVGRGRVGCPGVPFGQQVGMSGQGLPYPSEFTGKGEDGWGGIGRLGQPQHFPAEKGFD